jgi:8-oxo-dGTP diphosphatase
MPEVNPMPDDTPPVTSPAKPVLRVRVAVVLLHNGHLLLMRQNDKPFWVLPGGTLELGETLAQCAIRELDEETGLAITEPQLFSLSEYIDLPQRHVIDVVMTAKLAASPHPVPENWQAPFTENINAIAWFPLAALASLELKPQGIAKHLKPLAQQGEAALIAAAAAYFG